MFEGIIEKMLQKAFGKFLEGLDKGHLKVAIWSGNINLINVRIKHSFFKMLNLPVELKLGILRMLEVLIPWSHLGSKPVIARLEGLYIVLQSKPKAEWAPIDRITYAIKKELLDAFSEQLQQIAMVNL